MGFFEDLGKELDNFVKWAEDFEYEPVYYEEPDWDYLAADPEFTEVTDTFYAPIGDFFEFLEPEELLKKYKTPASPPDIVKDFVKAIRGEEEEVAEETWWAYYTTLDGGYYGRELLPAESQVYYSEFPNMEDAAMRRIEADYGDRYYGGQGSEVYASVDDTYRVGYYDVNEDDVL